MADHLLTQNAGHVHCGRVDAAGNGTSSIDAGHSHPIRGWAVQPAGAGPHSHNVTQQPCGAGGGPAKPCNCGRK